jgi:hypothetical protein
MREVLSTHDLSLALSARIALDTARIPYSANYGDGMEPSRSPMQLCVLDDADYNAARDVLTSLQVSPIAAAREGESKRFFWFCIALGFLVVLIIAWRWYALLATRS